MSKKTDHEGRNRTAKAGREAAEGRLASDSYSVAAHPGAMTTSAAVKRKAENIRRAATRRRELLQAVRRAAIARLARRSP